MCLTYFSDGVRKWPNKGDLREKVFIWVIIPRENTVHCGSEDTAMGAGIRHGAGLKSLRVHPQ